MFLNKSNNNLLDCVIYECTTQSPVTNEGVDMFKRYLWHAGGGYLCTHFLMSSLYLYSTHSMMHIVLLAKSLIELSVVQPNYNTNTVS